MRTRIRKARKARGMTQEDLADAASLDLVTIQRYEWGEYTPRIKQLVRVANALDVSVDWLIGRPITESPPLDEQGLTIAEMCYWLRHKRGLDVVGLGAESGVGEKPVRNIEAGRGCRIQTAVRLAEYFGVSVDYLCGRGKHNGI